MDGVARLDFGVRTTLSWHFPIGHQPTTLMFTELVMGSMLCVATLAVWPGVIF